MRRVVRDRSRHEQHHQHHHRESLHHARGLGQQHRAEREPAHAREDGAGEEAAFPHLRLLGRSRRLDVGLVDQVASHGHERDRDEPGEEARTGEVFPQDRAQREDHHERREVAHERKAE